MRAVVLCFGALVTWLTKPASAQFSYYAVDEASINAESQLTDSASTTLVNPESGCLCDVTRDVCDLNCCCDDVCTSAQRARFTTCMPTAPDLPTLNYCVEDERVAEVNLPNSGSMAVVKLEPSGDAFGRALMCIVSDRNPSYGDYFQDPLPGSLSLLEEALEAEAALPPASPETVTSRSRYDAGERIPIAYMLGGTALPSGYFSLPVSQFASDCIDGGTPVATGFDLPYASEGPRLVCQRLGTVADCVDGGSLSVSAIYETLRLAATPGSLPSVAPTVKTATYSNGASALNAAGALPAPALAAGVCENVPDRIVYTLVMTESGTLSDVQVALQLRNVTVSFDGVLTVDQAFGVTFRTAAELSKGQPVSGNPGYRPGAALLAGRKVEATQNAVAHVVRREVGLPLLQPSALDGRCERVSDASPPVRFGVDAVTSCAVSLTRDQLRSFCQTSAGPYWPSNAVPLPGYFSRLTSTVYVGVWGNSSAVATDDWLELSPPSSTSSMSWDETRSQCSNVVNSIIVEFLTASVGAVAAPQSKIQFARARYDSETWTHPAGRGSNNTAATYAINMVTRFVQQEQETKAVVRSLPPLQTSFPEDLFYPFTSGANSSRGSWMSVLMLVAAACLGIVHLVT